jgi:hypothetical protein
MKFEDFNLDGVRAVIDSMGRNFYANEVAEKPPIRDMLRPAPDEEDTYRRMVGKYLMAHRRELGLMDTRRERSGRGWFWQRPS